MTTQPRILSLLFFFLTLPLLFLIHHQVNPTGPAEFTEGRDIYFIFQDAHMLANGQNPYQRIKNKSLYENQKYTFYLPGFLLFAAGTIKLGFQDYHNWMQQWLTISMLFHVAIGVSLYYLLLSRSGFLFAALGASFWFFSRWPLALFRSGQIDAIPIFFLLLAFLLLKKAPRWALLCLGISLAIKQMAAFLIPLFFIEVWRSRSAQKQTLKEFGIDLMALLIVPFVASLPFLIWDYNSFFKMLLFPLTRDPRGARSIELFLNIPVEFAKLPFIGLLISSYWLAWRRRLPFATLCLWVMLLFLSFNSIFFSRYFCWVIPLIPLTLFSPSEEVH